MALDNYSPEMVYAMKGNIGFPGTAAQQTVATAKAIADADVAAAPFTHALAATAIPLAR